MIRPILARLSPLGRSLTLTGWLAVAVLVLGLLILAQCAQRAREDAREARRETAAVVRDQKARDKASEQRLTDAKSNAALKESLNDAVSSLPDAVPSDRRIAVACQRLRNQGTDTSSLTACR